jgi:uncharacterized protein YbjT (DUF2867 family)
MEGGLRVGIRSKSHQQLSLIAVIGVTGHQGGAVVRALQASGQYKVRALSRNPGKHRELADEVIEADLNRLETLKATFAGAHGVFLVTNFGEAGTDEFKQATTAVSDAKDAGATPTVQNDQFTYAVKTDSDHRFFRLR